MFSRRKLARVLVLGLDCASPDLIFNQFNADLPTFSRLMRDGTYGILESCIPCITVPAWASMLSSRDPGVLGCYGFRNRADYTYDRLTTADSRSIRAKRVWDYLTDAGKFSLVVGVPQTYPVHPLNGHLITDFLTPERSSAFAYPAMLKTEVLSLAPRYEFDVRNFRTIERADLLQKLIDLTETQYRVFENLLKSKSWDFAIHVNIGLDRIHHAFWRYHDPSHRLHDSASPFRSAIRDYYKLCDHFANRLIDAAGDDTTVLVVSDHGVKRMDGCICINEWLWRNGWLALKSPPTEGTITRFENVEVDWARTRAWGHGGYYGRIFFNVAGREPQGIISPDDLSAVRAELSAQLENISVQNHTPMNTTVYEPARIYQQVNGIAPDLIVYFGDLHWRAIGSLGYEQHYTYENDTGPDDANHAVEGMFIHYDPKLRGLGRISNHQLMDVAPTILSRLNVQLPRDLQGKPL
jgi:predicted AlkP superfamily phosphohydrolase/phosphomutase